MSIISNEIVSVQPLKQKLGQIFFLSFLYGSTKGTTQANSTMFSWGQVGQVPADPNYTSETVDGEVLGSSGLSSYSGNFSYTPLRSGTIVVNTTNVSGTVTISDDGQGNLVLNTATPVNVGTVNYTTGAFTLTLSAVTTSEVSASYLFNLETAPSTIPDVNVQVSEFVIQARPRKLKANYSFDASYDLQISQGLNIDDILLQAAASEIRHEIDVEITNDILNQAGLTTSWNLTPQDNTSWVDYKTTFVDGTVAASNMIYQATRRARGNFMIVGKKAADIIFSLGGERFKASGMQDPEGPYFAGVLDGQWRVYYNPYYPANKYVVGYKGDNFMKSGVQ